MSKKKMRRSGWGKNVFKNYFYGWGLFGEDVKKKIDNLMRLSNFYKK